MLVIESGIIILLRWLQSSNAHASMVVTFFPRRISSSEVQFQNVSYDTVVMLSGRVTFFSEVQLWNIYLPPVEVQPSAKTTVSRRVSPSNILSPKVVTLAGIKAFSRDVQAAKVYAPIFVVPSGILA